ncbi:hypothetical protein F5Y19DRAFT_478542 [Xylariaceae sp. FL1651]|nr:hypothetical protein F5Y19DRAFT_478542 [Xylariaceae sp. FL1651]
MGNSDKNHSSGHSSKKSKKDSHKSASKSSSGAESSPLERYILDPQPNERFAIGRPSERPTGKRVVQQWDDTWREVSSRR